MAVDTIVITGAGPSGCRVEGCEPCFSKVSDCEEFQGGHANSARLTGIEMVLHVVAGDGLWGIRAMFIHAQ